MPDITSIAIRSEVESFLPPGTSTRDINAITARLSSFIEAHDLSSRLNGFVSLKEWVDRGALEHRRPRLDLLLALMEARPALMAAFQEGIREILKDVNTVELFAETGLHPHDNIWSEGFRRTVEKILPQAGDASDFSKFISRLYPNASSIEHLLALPDDSFRRLAHLLAPASEPTVWLKQRQELQQAFRLLSVHIAGLGLSPGLRARSHAANIEDSPFYRLQQTATTVIQEAGTPAALESWCSQVARCREELDYVHRRMEDAGVSTALVFDMRTIEHAMSRMESIARVLYVEDPHRQIEAVKHLLDDVMSARRNELSVRAVFSDNSALLARKIVERSGKAGENYIANSRREYRRIWIASLGGGLLTVLTAAIKLRIGAADFPPFVEGVAAGTNYAVSFLIMHQLHLALATKQPSVTAAAFAGIVRSTRGQARLERLAEFISRITRSQLASAFGNLIAVGAGCVLFAWLWLRIFGQPYLTVPNAEYVYKTLDPVTSGTSLYAILTGIILWISALAGGWCENFATFNRIPQAIAQHPLGRTFGVERMQRLAAFVDANLSGWATSIVLGYLLGFVPALGHFFGIPLDVRHVTLSSGTLALAAASFGRDWLYRGWFLHTVFGIAVIFALNLSVSFMIAASVAMKAYGVSPREQRKVWRFTTLAFMRSPARFFFPPRALETTKPSDDDQRGDPAEEDQAKAATHLNS